MVAVRVQEGMSKYASGDHIGIRAALEEVYNIPFDPLDDDFGVR